MGGRGWDEKDYWGPPFVPPERRGDQCVANEKGDCRKLTANQLLMQRGGGGGVTRILHSLHGGGGNLVNLSLHNW